MAEQSRPGQGGSPGSSKLGIEQKANQATQRVAEKAQSGFENARTNVTTQVNAVAQALTSAADKLQQQDQNGLSQRAKQYVQKAEQAAQYLQDKSPQELKQDLEQFARDKPAWFLGGALVAGLLGARFLKSSRQSSDGDRVKGAVEYARA